MGYANPDAVTQIANGLSTTTYAYDNNGNLVSSGNGTATTTYTYDYANRLIALNAGGATTTYGDDAFGQRVIQTGASTTTIYPFKWYSIASSTGTGAKYATTTSYMFIGDTMLATVDQQTVSGVASGTAQTRFIHPDHLGSTNIVTDQNDNVVQTLDYYPYGSQRISNATNTNEQRKYIGQFGDQSGLDYFNARYMDPSRGQFTSEEPIFLNIGDPNQVKQLSQQEQQTYLTDPQVLNSYSYGRDNPITRKDPNGKQAVAAVGIVVAPELAPVLVPAAIITTAVVGTYYATDYLLRNNGGMQFIPFSQQGRAVQLSGPPSLFPDGEPPKVPDSKWLKWGLAGSLVVDLASSVYDPLKDLKDSILQWKNASQNNQNSSKATNVQSQSIQFRPSIAGYAQSTPSTLPATVTQNGTTYVRNSSGLLIFATSR